MNPAQDVADNIQKLIDDLKRRIAITQEGVLRSPLEAQLREQESQLAYVKKVGGLK